MPVERFTARPSFPSIKKMKKVAIYPGSFDPVTYGHIDLIERASAIFDRLIVAIARNQEKKTLFNVAERRLLLEQATKKFSNVVIDDFKGLLVNYALKKEAKVIVRGLRAISDFEFEFQMALTNRSLAGKVETLFLMPNERYAYFSSRILKEIVALGGDAKHFVPSYVEEKLKTKLNRA